jgi:phosphate transport system protein
MPEGSQHNFSIEMAQARQRLYAVSSLALQQFEQALQAYVTQNPVLARQALSQLPKVHDFEIEMDDHCLDMLSHTASNGDLRLVLALLKAIRDIEQISTQANQIAQQVLLASTFQPALSQLTAIATLAEPVAKMLTLALAALQQQSIGKAEQAQQLAPLVNRYYGSILRCNVPNSADQSELLDSTLSVNWVARALERIAEHSVNLAKQAIFLAKVSSGQSLRVELQPRRPR